ncbi:MAG: LptE family protein [Bacteroidota bacterium]
MTLKIKTILSTIFLLTLLQACGVYSFTGTTITAETISIGTFFNDASNGPANLGVTFTDQLRDYFQSNTSLTQVNDGGELQMEGSIVSYRITPVAPSAAQSDRTRDVANLTRLTITVKVDYVNLENEDFSFTKNFSQFADFDSDLGITAVEGEKIDEIFELIILDIFNASVANW